MTLVSENLLIITFLKQIMSIINIGIIREGKTPPDFRVPLSPEQCKQLQDTYPQVTVTVQTSPIRCFSDQAYFCLLYTSDAADE